MAVDMEQFHQVFFEESEEGLDILEQGLLSLNEGEVDTEIINSIFRAAHSIKGGSATFGFIGIAEFTHVMETLLDEMRNGERAITQNVVDILLRAGDCLRDMMANEQNDTPYDDETINSCMQQMEQLHQSPDGTDPDAIIATVHEQQTEDCGCWEIAFRPFPHFMQTGNDPIRMLNTLADLGEISLLLHHNQLPSFGDINAEFCYLSWTVRLYGKVEKKEIEEIFEWVDGDCELEIKQITPTGQSPCHKQKTPENEQTSTSSEENEEPVTKSAISAETKVTQPLPAATITKKTATASNKKPAVKKSGGTIRVEIKKIDELINMMGELVITQSMLSTIGEDFHMDKVERLQQGLAQLERHSRILQESVMRIRMMPISNVFNRFPRLVHDLSKQLGKQIELKINGENTELDKTVIEQIGDPLVHLVRNSLDHGIELPELRAEKGKHKMGVIELNACHRGGSIVIEIKDDGAGLNADKILEKAIEKGLVSENDMPTEEKIYELIMQPGFSTAEQITDVSGRGVGMDVVRKNIESLGGTINIQSVHDKGSTITITLPLTLAILDGQSVSVGGENYIVPIISIIESIQIKPGQIGNVKGGGEVLKLRNEYISVIRLDAVFGIHNAKFSQLDEGLLVVVESGGEKCGLFVDELNGQQQVVIKSLEANFKRMPGISGATILGDGSVAFILDIPGIIKLAGEKISQYGQPSTVPLKRVV